MELLRAYDRRAIKTKKGSLGEIDMLDLVMNADLKSGNGVCTMNEADMALSCVSFLFRIHQSLLMIRSSVLFDLSLVLQVARSLLSMKDFRVCDSRLPFWTS